VTRDEPFWRAAGGASDLLSFAELADSVEELERLESGEGDETP
jgi:hypothetical protein